MYQRIKNRSHETNANNLLKSIVNINVLSKPKKETHEKNGYKSIKIDCLHKYTF